MPKPDKPAPSVKHPHVRGEDSSHFFPLAPTIETPPRAWGRPPPTPCRFATTRNTPTCVGKTLDADRAQAFREKHPHVRGEDLVGYLRTLSLQETPPRAWGRLLYPLKGLGRLRNTPTCVGKTIMRLCARHSAKETPPRAWGRHQHNRKGNHSRRNTPTCVGKTSKGLGMDWRGKKHPHVRGEDSA